MSTQYIVDEKGEKVSVVLSMDEYRALLDRAADGRYIGSPTPSPDPYGFGWSTTAVEPSLTG
jgi:hypothetical protein